MSALMTEDEAARVLRVCTRTLRKARMGGQDGEDAPAGEMPWVRSVRDLDAQEAHAPRTNKGVLMMPEEWFEIAYINFNKAILHGRAMAGKDEFGCRKGRRWGGFQSSVNQPAAPGVVA